MYKVLKERDFLINSSNDEWIDLITPEFNMSCSFDKSGNKLSVFSLPDVVINGIYTLTGVDNNYDLSLRKKENNLWFTANAVANEMGSVLTKKTDWVAPSDLYELTKDSWEQPIHIQIVSSETGALRSSFILKMDKYLNSTNIFSVWQLSATVFLNKISAMSLTHDAIKPNNSPYLKNRKRGDLNLLALLFIFKTVGFNVDYYSNDEDIIKSFNTFQYIFNNVS